jgi:Asp-tRNA(Asn)/Glu-tRNA(Gln) amidotransferase A subunit family amidase
MIGTRRRRQGTKIGIVKRRFEQVGAEPAVNEGVREAAKRLGRLGAILEWISIPAHLTAAAVWTPIGTEVGRLEEDLGTGNEMLAVAHG